MLLKCEVIPVRTIEGYPVSIPNRDFMLLKFALSNMNMGPAAVSIPNRDFMLLKSAIACQSSKGITSFNP